MHDDIKYTRALRSIYIMQTITSVTLSIQYYMLILQEENSEKSTHQKSVHMDLE